MANIGCMASNLPFTYLGVKVGANMTHINSWQEVIQKVTSKLSKWKAKALSVGGRPTLIKSVLGSLPTYYMSMFKVPAGVLNHLGGLWLDIIKAIYGPNRCLDQPSSAHKGCSVWLMVHNAISNLKSKGVNLMKFCKKVRFNRLFNLELQRHVSIAQKLQNSDYTSSFRRRPRGGAEECQWQKFTQLLSSVVLSSTNDRWSWTLNGNGIFLVKSAREVIDKHLLIISSTSTRWSKLIPIKLNIFTWRLFLDKLPTRINLSNRGMDIPCVLCPVCGSKVEPHNHLFFGCSLALDLF
ncbi:RNA-directed DNA polymerase, eukaryota, reverse transcriptase zinc-binding domain protein [Tanacetum coccineum]